MKSNDYENKEEYQNIINRLNEIQAIKENLKIISESNHYNAHIKLPGTFDELLLILKREKDNLLEQIDFEKIRLYNTLKIETKKDKDKIMALINSIIISIKDNNYTMSDDYNIFYSKDLQFFYESIKNLISKLNANEFLTMQIYDLQKEQELLLEKKADFEKISLLKKIFLSINHKS